TVEGPRKGAQRRNELDDFGAGRRRGAAFRTLGSCHADIPSFAVLSPCRELAAAARKAGPPMIVRRVNARWLREFPSGFKRRKGIGVHRPLVLPRHLMEYARRRGERRSVPCARRR